MRTILLTTYQMAALFAGLALAFNVLFFFVATNWPFLILITLLGALVGLALGMLLRKNEPERSEFLWLGSIGTALFMAVLVIAFSYFFSDGHVIVWRTVIALALISSAPGLVVGWLLSQQAAEGSRQSQPALATGRLPPAGRKGPAAEPYVRRGPLPPSTGDDGAGGEWAEHGRAALEQRVRAEAQNLSPYAYTIESADGGQRQVVSVRVPGRGETLNIYVVCPLGYPNIAPQVMIEKMNAFGHGGGQQVEYQSGLLGRWNGRYSLRDLVDEAVRSLARV